MASRAFELARLARAAVVTSSQGILKSTNDSSIPTAAAVKAYADAAVPAGTVSYFAMSSAPEGWLKANGAAISRTTYVNLFSAIGTTFGSGDGLTTYNLPDLRGEFVRSWDDGRGVDSGRSFGSFQQHQLQDHQHLEGSLHYTNLRGHAPYGKVSASGLANNYFPYGVVSRAYTSSTGGTSNNSENRPQNVALLACIKY